MTTDEIRAELRRSAMEDAHPFRDCAPSAYYAAASSRTLMDAAMDAHRFVDQHRMFFLLVAEAL